MNTKRHNYDLRYHQRIVIAPRFFTSNDYFFFVHIHKTCDFVDLWIKVNNIDNDTFNVVYYSTLKLFSNKKGLYFNFSNWISDFKKETKRVYLCE